MQVWSNISGQVTGFWISLCKRGKQDLQKWFNHFWNILLFRQISFSGPTLWKTWHVRSHAHKYFQWLALIASAAIHASFAQRRPIVTTVVIIIISQPILVHHLLTLVNILIKITTGQCLPACSYFKLKSTLTGHQKKLSVVHGDWWQRKWILEFSSPDRKLSRTQGRKRVDLLWRKKRKI